MIVFENITDVQACVKSLQNQQAVQSVTANSYLISIELIDLVQNPSVSIGLSNCDPETIIFEFDCQNETSKTLYNNNNNN